MMSSYIGIFKMQFKGELQYRAKAFSGIITQFFWGVMYVYLYTSFMKQGSVEGFSIAQMATYVWLGQAFFHLRYLNMPKNAAPEITSGNVCYKFVKPINIYNQWYAEYMGEKLAGTLLRCFPIIIIAFLLPQNIGLSLPVSWLAFLLFVLSLLIGAMLGVAISMIIVYLVFKTLSPKGTSGLVMSVCGILGGTYIPLPLMPLSLQKVLNYLPFRFISDLPLWIYIGNVGISSALVYIAISLAWLVFVVLLGKLLLKSALKKTEIQGG